MIKYDKVQAGIAKYLDAELITKLDEDSVQKVLVGVAISLYIKKFSNLIAMAQDKPAIKMLDIIDDKGNIDIDTIKKELEKQIPDTGIKVDLPLIGTMTFHKSDIATLYEYIVEETL